MSQTVQGTCPWPSGQSGEAILSVELRLNASKSESGRSYTINLTTLSKLGHGQSLSFTKYSDNHFYEMGICFVTFASVLCL